MDEKEKKEVVQTRGRIQRLKAEFSKIVWPDKETLWKNTIAVVLTSIILGLIIAGLDALIKTGISFLMNI